MKEQNEVSTVSKWSKNRYNWSDGVRELESKIILHGPHRTVGEIVHLEQNQDEEHGKQILGAEVENVEGLG